MVALQGINNISVIVKNKIDQYNNVQLKEILLFLNKFDKEQPKKINKNKIALIGLRGAGKTTLGAMFSEEFNMPLYEITNEIGLRCTLRKTNKSLNDIILNTSFLHRKVLTRAN